MNDEMTGKKLSHSQFGNKIAKILKDKGCWLFNIHGERMQKRFVPDLLVIGLAWKGFIEFKVGNDKCSDGQKMQIEKIKKRNFPCYVLRYNVELDCVQVEDRDGEILNLVAWEALWNWLKRPISLIIHDSPSLRNNNSKIELGGMDGKVVRITDENLRQADKIGRQ